MMYFTCMRSIAEAWGAWQFGCLDCPYYWQQQKIALWYFETITHIMETKAYASV